LDLHSSSSSIDFSELALLASQSASELGATIENCNTTAQVLEVCDSAAVPIGNLVCEKAMTTIRKYTADHIRADVVAVDRDGKVVGRAS
ncbi:MAG: cobalt-precorrin-5B (C(1))-methyltransferase, partial [Pseudomonadota bacterium]